MSFMNAKEARPVDDPKALVPFGWAPGGYHCAACSTCGEAHSGSDKRSMRCQDCAEALRDKRADEPASTTGEITDHAELAACPFCGGSAALHDGMGEFWVRCDDCDASGAMRSRGDCAIRDWNERAPQAALLSEIAALRGEVERVEADRIRTVDDRMTWTRRTLQAERQRDELRKALERQCDNMSFVLNRVELHAWADKFSTEIAEDRALLANHGADQ